MGAFLTQGHAHFSSGCGFMVGLSKPKLRTKFEVFSFSHCVNIEGKAQIWGAPLAQYQANLFYACDFMMSLGKPKAVYQIWSR